MVPGVVMFLSLLLVVVVVVVPAVGRRVCVMGG